MSLDDRLTAQRQAISYYSEEPVEACSIAEEIVDFALLLLESDRYNETIKSEIRKVASQAGRKIRPGFSDLYKIEYLKAAMWLAGLYDSVYLD